MATAIDKVNMKAKVLTFAILLAAMIALICLVVMYPYSTLLVMGAISLVLAFVALIVIGREAMMSFSYHRPGNRAKGGGKPS